jgi:hypothetical protein
MSCSLSTSKITAYFNTTGLVKIKKLVTLMGAEAFQKHQVSIERIITNHKSNLAELDARRITMNDKDIREQTVILHNISNERMAVDAYESLLADITKHRGEDEQRVIGYVKIAPPFTPNFHPDPRKTRKHDQEDETEPTDDWALVQLYSSVLPQSFDCNVIDLRSVPRQDIETWMSHGRPDLTIFKYPNNGCLRFSGTVPDHEIFKPNPKFVDFDGIPCTMAMMNGMKSGLKVGRLNTMEAFCRTYFPDEPPIDSLEVCVLPRDTSSGPFSERGDSGSAVVDGKGRVCGILTGGNGIKTVPMSDCSFITSINFLLSRLKDFDIHAEILTHRS